MGLSQPIRIGPKANATTSQKRGRAMIGAILISSAAAAPNKPACDCWRGDCQPDGSCLCDAGFAGPSCRLAVDDFCPSSCSGHGECLNNGTCVCRSGFTGDACDERTDEHFAACSLLSFCSGHGRCDGSKCICEPGFAQPDCSAVVGTASCPNNCAGHGKCLNGVCVCGAGYSGDACDVLIATPNTAFGPDIWSGVCPHNCSGHGWCLNGACDCAAGFGGPACEHVVKVATCADHCSGHGRCVGSPTQQPSCQCTPALHYMWSGPSCATLKPPSGCSNGCSGHGVCVSMPGKPHLGHCACSFGFSGADCSIVKPCPDRCNGRGDCVNGQCECERGWQGVSCEAPACPKDCSGHGLCLPPPSHLGLPGSSGAMGLCQCSAGWGGIACDVWRPHCPNDCSGRGECVDGRCVCAEGFVGDGCGERKGAAPSASLAAAVGEESCGARLCGGNGQCVRSPRAAGTLVCACFDGFGGARCERRGAPRGL